MKGLYSMRFFLSLLASVAALASGPGCYPESTLLDFIFPTEMHFLYSETAEVHMFDLEQGEIDPCPALLTQVVDRVGTRDTSFRQTLDICNLRDGGFLIDDIGNGNRAFVAAVRDDEGAIILSGCTIGATYVEAPEIGLILAQTKSYQETIDRVGLLSCTTIEEKCGQGCQ